jgi:hypothetical protein
MITLDCIVCRKALEPMREDPEAENQPEEGLAFTTHGHWPSSIIDIFDGIYLEINVCNTCLLKAAEEGRVAVGESDKQNTSLKPWRPPQ